MSRRSRLQALIDAKAAGNQADFARLIRRSPAVVWQYLSGHRVMGEKLARHIEQALRVEPGWLDMDDEAPTAPGAPTALERICQAAGTGRLSEADLFLLAQIAERLANPRQS